jgi:glycogen operon protein
MFLAGDEFLHTQGGNNNAWCQNNEISWLDWRLAEANHEMVRFVRELIAFRQRHPSLSRSRFFTGQPESSRGIPDITWHGLQLNEPLWNSHEAQILAFTIAGRTATEEDLHIVLNMSEQGIESQLPDIPQRLWHLAIDTAAPSPDDILEQARQRAADGNIQKVQARSVVVFEAREIK